MLLTRIGELEALVGVRPVGVELEPQVVRRAIEDQPHELILGEGSQRTGRTVSSVVHLRRSRHVRMLAMPTGHPNLQRRDFVWHLGKADGSVEAECVTLRHRLFPLSFTFTIPIKEKKSSFVVPSFYPDHFGHSSYFT